MCVAALAWHAHPHWRLVVAANRDEFHARPAAPLARWADDTRTIIAGRDLQAGGTWLGVNGDGRMALVTNYRVEGYPKAELASRGMLVSGWLRGQPLPDVTTMNPFNLVLADTGAARVLSNWPQPAERTLAPGIHGISNGAFGAPWARAERLCAALASSASDCTALFDALADETPLASTPPVFIRDPVYGTRCSTVVLIGHDGAGEIAERRFGPDGAPAGETRIAF